MLNMRLWADDGGVVGIVAEDMLLILLLSLSTVFSTAVDKRFTRLGVELVF